MSNLTLSSSELRALLDATRACMDQCAKMLEYESEKRRSLLKAQYQKLPEIVAAQQASIMQLYNLESQRVQAQADAGLENLSAKEIVMLLKDPQERAAVEGLLNEWTSMVDRLKAENQAALEIAQEDLRTFYRLSSAGDSAALTYDRSGLATSAVHKSFEEKI